MLKKLQIALNVLGGLFTIEMLCLPTPRESERPRIMKVKG